jgi:glycosyltransferase involved in cell wall biosynthesis
MVSRPRFSIVMPLRNAATILPDALRSLEKQSCPDFKVIVVDGQSTDATLEIVAEAASKFEINIISERDRSLADALAKGLARADTDIVSVLCADERYSPDALARASRWFDEFPEAIVYCGRADLIDERGIVRQGAINREFDLHRHLACELVLPISACFFNRSRLGTELHYDASFPTCPDYEIWGRLGFQYSKTLFKIFDQSVVSALATRDSMSFRSEAFVQLARDKIAHLENLLAKFVDVGNRNKLRERSIAGIKMWAAEQLRSIEPNHPAILEFCKEAARLDPIYARTSEFVEANHLGTVDPKTGAISIIPSEPSSAAKPVAGTLQFVTFPYWPGARILEQIPFTIQMADSAWGYSAMASPLDAALGSELLWLRLDVEVKTGSVGVGRLVGERLLGERIVSAGEGVVTVFIPFIEGTKGHVMLRNGPQGGSIVTVHSSSFLLD